MSFEDPRLSNDGMLPGRSDNRVVMWSYPVIEDGLIYVVDLRNGLYILKYNGPHEQEVADVKFLEGNSNQGDALCYEPCPARSAPTARPRPAAAPAAPCRRPCR